MNPAITSTRTAASNISNSTQRTYKSCVQLQLYFSCMESTLMYIHVLNENCSNLNHNHVSNESTKLRPTYFNPATLSTIIAASTVLHFRTLTYHTRAVSHIIVWTVLHVTVMWSHIKVTCHILVDLFRSHVSHCLTIVSVSVVFVVFCYHAI